MGRRKEWRRRGKEIKIRINERIIGKEGKSGGGRRRISREWSEELSIPEAANYKHIFALSLSLSLLGSPLKRATKLRFTRHASKKVALSRERGSRKGTLNRFRAGIEACRQPWSIGNRWKRKLDCPQVATIEEEGAVSFPVAQGAAIKDENEGCSDRTCLTSTSQAKARAPGVVVIPGPWRNASR